MPLNLIIQLLCLVVAIVAVILFRSEIVPFKIFGILFALPIVIWLITALVTLVKKGLFLFKGNGFQIVDFSSLGLSVLIIALTVMFFQSAKKYPRIHDITTDIMNPPLFDVIKSQRRADDNPLDYDSSISQLQLESYGSVKTLTTKLSLSDSLTLAKTVAEKLNWTIIAVNTEAGTIESSYKSQVFGFVDDIIIRISPTDQGALVDLRSVSRVGESDFGANAERINAFLLLYNELEKS